MVWQYEMPDAFMTTTSDVLRQIADRLEADNAALIAIYNGCCCDCIQVVVDVN